MTSAYHALYLALQAIYQKVNVIVTGGIGLFTLILTIFQISRAVLKFRKKRPYEMKDLNFKTERKVIKQVVVLMSKFGESTIFDDVLDKFKDKKYTYVWLSMC